MPGCCNGTLNLNDELVATAAADPRNCSYLSYELSGHHVDRVMEGRDLAVFKGLSLFRDPMEHAFSALGHMQRKHPADACRNMTQYLSGARCRMYDLHNMQTERLGYTPGREPGLTTAIRRVDRLFFVGVTQHYAASVCLLRYQMGQFNQSACDCRKQQDHLPVFNRGEYGPGAPGYTLDNIKELRARMQLDYMLWDHALMVFYARVRHVESRFGIQIICPGPSIDAHTAQELGHYAVHSIDHAH